MPLNQAFADWRPLFLCLSYSSAIHHGQPPPSHIGSVLLYYQIQISQFGHFRHYVALSGYQGRKRQMLDSHSCRGHLYLAV